MLDAIYQLGLVQKQDKFSSLVTATSGIKHVVGIIFRSKDGKVKYDNSKLFEIKPASVTLSSSLFKRDFSGRPGLFLTGNISYSSIDKIRQIVQASKNIYSNPEIQKFANDKILWFPRGKLVSNPILFNTLKEQRKKELSGIFDQFEKKGKEIAKDVIEILTKDLPERTLLTIMIHEYGDKEAKFVGQIHEYSEFFRRGVLSKKYKADEELTCSVCNRKRLIGTFTEKTLPFYIVDKPMFFQNADPRQATKGFPVCDDCYLELQKGIQFIQNKLDYHISSVQSMQKSEINFWLIPHLNDHLLIMDFKNELGNKNLYLNSLKDLCSTLKLISKVDYHERKNLESFLRFSALFYTFDTHAIMRVVNYIQGIYPSQLQKLFEIKEKIDQQYPFQEIADRFKREDFFVGLPLLITFYKDIKSQWQSQVISILDKIFTGQQIPLDEIIQNINIKIRESTLKSLDLRSLSRIAFLGLMLLEYLISLNKTEQIEKLAQSQHNQPITEDIEHVEKFIESHANILIDGTRRAVFAIGVCVGILLEVQEQRYNKTAPFWNRLSRLDLDLERIIQLLPEVKSKLAMYNERRFNTVVDYLGANEVSRIDMSSSISNDNLNLVFSVGLSYGYMLKRGYFKS